MKHYRIKILRKGDNVLHVSETQVIVKRANGEVDIIRFTFDEDGLPRIDSSAHTTITFGDGEIEAIESEDSSKSSPKRGKRTKTARSRTSRKAETIIRTF